MNQASNIVQFDGSSGAGSYTTTDATTNTVTISSTCSSCGQYYIGYHTCPTIVPNYYWYQNWLPAQSNEVAELKAWIEGFLDGRKLTEGNLRKVRDKIEAFLG